MFPFFRNVTSSHEVNTQKIKGWLICRSNKSIRYGDIPSPHQKLEGWQVAQQSLQLQSLSGVTHNQYVSLDNDHICSMMFLCFYLVTCTLHHLPQSSGSRMSRPAASFPAMQCHGVPPWFLKISPTGGLCCALGVWGWDIRGAKVCGKIRGGVFRENGKYAWLFGLCWDMFSRGGLHSKSCECYHVVTGPMWRRTC